MKKLLFIALMLCTGLAVVSCNNKKATLDDLNGSWSIVTVDGQQVQEAKPYINFNVADRRIHGNFGCNIINGEFTTDDNRADAIAFERVASTMMACPNMELEDRIMTAFHSAERFGKLKNGNMALYNEAGTPVIELLRK